MATTIITKYGSGAPTASDVVRGELAVDTENKRLYTENSGGSVVELGTNPAANVTFGDNVKAIFGAGSDLQIYHNGTTQDKIESSSAYLILEGSNIILRNNGGTEDYAKFFGNGAVELYSDNSKKLATTSSGIDVTGEVEADTAHFGTGTGTGAGVADEVVVSGPGSTGLTIHSPDASNATLGFGSASANDYAFVQGYYNSGSPFLRFSIQNSEKAKVTSTGIDVTGTVTADGLTVSNSSLQVKLEEADGTYNPRLVTYFDSSGTHLQHTWSSGATNLIFEAGGSEGSGTERMRIDGSTGNVKIGTGTDRFSYLTASAANLQIDGGLVFEPGSGNDAEILNYRTSAMIFGNSGTEDMRLDSSGNVGIGTTSPSSAAGFDAKLQLESANPMLVYKETDQSTKWEVGAWGGNYVVYNGTSERLRVDSSGNVGIGTSPASGVNLHLHEAGSGQMLMAFTNDTTGTGSNDGLHVGIDSSENAFIYNKENTALYFGTNNTERMRIEGSTGNAGIGTSSPEKRVHIYDSTQANQALRFGNPAATPYGEINYQSLGLEHLYITAKGTTTGYGNIVFSTGPTPTAAMQINSDGSTSIKANAGGLTHVFGYNENGGEISLYDDGGSQATLIDQSNNSTRVLELINGSDLAIGLGAANTTGNVIFYGAGLDEAFRVDSSGHLMVGKSSTPLSVQGTTLFNDGTAYHTVDGNAAMRINRLTSDGEIIDIRKDGSTVGSISVTASATAYNTSSDQRLKENIVDAPSASDDIDAIQVRSFDWKVDGSHQKYGMVAQELVTVTPEAVSQPEDPEEMMGVDYSKLVPMLIKEVQQLRARVAQLEGAN